MRFLLSSCALVLAGLLPSQATSPAPAAPAAPAAADLAAAKARVSAALQKCATLADTSFAMKWGPDKKKKADDPFARMMAGMATGQTKGSWHADLAHVRYEGDTDDELLVAGRRTLAKDGTVDWRLRSGRFADGNANAYVPDVALLLQQLASWDLAVTNRSVGSLDDRPVEIVSVTLSADQVADAVWAGLLPEAIVTANGLGGGRILRMGMNIGGGNRTPATPPDTTIDLAVHLDPATNLVHQLHFRGWTKDAQGGAAGGVFVVQAGGARVAGGGDEEEDEEEDETKESAAKKDAPLVYENGLPTRPRKKTSVCDVTVKLSQHGQTPAPALTDAQKKLLGR